MASFTALSSADTFTASPKPKSVPAPKEPDDAVWTTVGRLSCSPDVSHKVTRKKPAALVSRRSGDSKYCLAVLVSAIHVSNEVVMSMSAQGWCGFFGGRLNAGDVQA